jgi:DNA-directed RNA polymerase subunit RPC12/RpoP
MASKPNEYGALARSMNFGLIEKCNCNPPKPGHWHCECLVCGLKPQCRHKRNFKERSHANCRDNTCDNSSNPERLLSWKKEAQLVNLTWLAKTIDRAYGLYSCNSCLDELTFQYSHVREKIARCDSCASKKQREKYEREATNAGYQIIGAGTGTQSLLYKCLTCGNENSKSIFSVRYGIECLNCEWYLAGIKKGLLQLSKTSSRNKIRNKFVWKNCEHIKVLQATQLKSGNPKCLPCEKQRVKKKFDDEAIKAGLVRIKRSPKKEHSIYEFIECGCRVTKQHTHVRNGSIRCSKCFSDDLEIRLAEEARDSNFEYLGQGKNRHYRCYRCLTCSFVDEKQPSAIRQGKDHATCKNCFELDLKSYLNGTGHKFIRLVAGERAELKLACGHRQEVRFDSIRNKSINCIECDDSHLNQPSNVYLFQIEFGDKAWLKLGKARNPETRSQGYGLHPQAKLSEVARREFPTGIEAYHHEQRLLKKYKKHRLQSKDMRHMMPSGHTECYPTGMLNLLQRELK